MGINLYFIKLFLITGLIFLLNVKISYAADPIGKIFNLTDFYTSGSAYDPDCPEEPVEVHVYNNGAAGEGAASCLAEFICPWDGVCPDFDGGGVDHYSRLERKGFWCHYLHPVSENVVNYTSNIKIALLNKCGDGNTVWMDKNSGYQNISSSLDRDQNTVFIEKPGKYKIGINKKYGAVVEEYYNKRLASSIERDINLIDPEPGFFSERDIWKR